MKILKSQKQIRQNASRIHAPYDEIFLKTKKLLRHDITPREKRMDILLDFSELLADASMNKQPPEELFPDGFDSFYAELVSGIPSYSAERRVKKMKNLAVVCGALAFIVICGGIYLSGYIDLYMKGMAAFVENPTRYKYDIEEINQDVNFIVDLDDLESNIGKAVYTTGACTVKIDSIDKSAGYYRIGFRTYGTYDIHGGYLITGQLHTRNLNATYTMSVQSELYYENETESIPCQLAGASGMNGKDGDHFSYYLPQEAKEGEITLSLRGLLQYKWYD